jgi:hypothetical protein
MCITPGIIGCTGSDSRTSLQSFAWTSSKRGQRWRPSMVTALSPGPALHLLQPPIECGQIGHAERRTIFQVRDLAVPLDEPDTVPLGAFRVMRLPGVTDRVFHAHAWSIVLHPEGSRMFRTMPSRCGLLYFTHASMYRCMSSRLLFSTRCISIVV